MAVLKHSGLETDFRLATILDEAMYVSLYDMADCRSIPGMCINLGSVNGTGSDTHQLRFADLGAVPLAVTGDEDTQLVGTAVTTSTNRPTIAVARQGLGREVSDLAVLTGFAADLDPATLARFLADGYRTRFMDMCATAIATASSNVGVSGADMTVDDFYDATIQLEITDNNGPFFACLHGRQTADLRESLRAEGGAVQWMEPTGAFLALKGQGLQGELLGVTIFKCSRVTAAGGNREGALWSAGAIGYKTGQVDARSYLGSSAIVVQQGEVTVEVTHVAGGGKAQIFGDAYLGVSLLEQARIVGIVTDQ